MGKDWMGDIVFSDTLAIFRGHVGDNRAHRHWASQLTIALDGEVEFEVTAGRHQSRAIYFPSRTEHRLISGFVCSIYFDPLSSFILESLHQPAARDWATLSSEQLPGELATITAETDLRTLLTATVLNPPGLRQTQDPRLQEVINQIKTQLGSGKNISRSELAALIHLSPTRFSHWFVEQTGIPLRSYKKWFKLRIAMDALLDGKGPMDAAMNAGFSDLAHMSREFSESLGLTYADAQRAWSLSSQI